MPAAMRPGATPDLLKQHSEGSSKTTPSSRRITRRLAVPKSIARSGFREKNEAMEDAYQAALRLSLDIRASNILRVRPAPEVSNRRKKPEQLGRQ
ncbi:hypothetical protein SmB9_00200 [Sphingosinicella microcystinivorans]|uniref:Uncharacterized protein n=1 Tax=Sphingosinicella microcystinivorans TaxID=335406 RepID=A0AAD1D1Y3_SPHMI|nr:hypothetical protein SmB9_00200 [Sphingosinicella microcystinivorans]